MEPAPDRKESDTSDKKGFRPEDEASYYLGNNFELGGVRFGPEEKSGAQEEKDRNLSRFGEEVWNESDHLGPGAQEKNQRDRHVLEEVRTTLAEHPWLDASEIEVEVKQGVVWLTGLVDTREDKREAQRLVDDLPAVKDVMNVIKIRSL